MNPPTIEQRMALQRRPNQRVVMYQRWEDLLFLHWEANAEVIQSTLPQGLTVDCHEDKAYLAIVPFKMRAIRPRGLPAVPYLSNFLECNVRTYVHDSDGVPGVWFYSLDTDRWIAYWIARKFFRLPYVWSRMRHQQHDQNRRYQVHRRAEIESSGYAFEAERASHVTEPGSLPFFFLERYLLYSFDSRHEQLFRGRVYHKPYEIAEVSNCQWDPKPIAWNHFPEPTGPPIHACYSERVVVEVFPLETVTS